MRVRLRVVAQRALGQRVVLLRQQAGRARAASIICSNSSSASLRRPVRRYASISHACTGGTRPRCRAARRPTGSGTRSDPLRRSASTAGRSPGTAGRRRAAARTGRSTAPPRRGRRRRRRRCTRRTSSFQPCSSTFAAMGRAAPTHSARPGRPCRSRQPQRPVDRHPAHHLASRRGAAAGRRASQMPWSGSCQRRADRLHHRLHEQRDVVVRELAAARSASRAHQVGDRPEHVELHLAVRGVADAHRAGAGVAGQGLDHGLRAELAAVARCTAGAAAPGGRRCCPRSRRSSAAAPRPPRWSRGRPAPARSAPRRAASSSGSPSCGRRRAPPGSDDGGGGQDRRRSARGTGRAGSARCAAPVAGASRGQLQRRGPVRASGCSVAASRSARPSTAARVESCRSPAQLQHAACRRRGEVDRGARGRCRPSSTIVPFDAGRVEHHRLVASRAPRSPSPIGCSRIGTWPKSGRGANSTAAGPDRPASTRTSDRCRCDCRVEPVGHGQARPAGLDRHRAAAGSAGRAAGRRAPGGPRSARPARRRPGRRTRAGESGPRVAQPGDPGVRRHEGDGVAVGQHRVPLDRHRLLAEEPAAAGSQEQRRAPAPPRAGRRRGSWRSVSPTPTLMPRSGPCRRRTRSRR